MNIVELSLSKIKPYERNARKNDHAVDAVAKSISQCEYVAPIVVDENNVILAGHTRWKALKKLGYKEIEVVIKSGLTDDQKRKYRLLDNKTGELADWDFDLLTDELEGLDFGNLAIDWGVEEAGGDDGETRDNEKDFSSKDTEIKSKNGDIYMLGIHRLMCGDSTSDCDVRELLNGSECDTYVCDPPFEMHELYSDCVIDAPETKKILVMYDHKHFGYAIKALMDRGCTPQYEFIWDCVQSWYTPNRPLARHKTCSVFRSSPDWDFDNAIIDDGKKRTAGTVTNTRGTYKYEPLASGVHMRTVEAFSNTQLHDDQGHGKPLEWIKAILNGVRAKSVCDLFGGSGTLLIACEKLQIPSFTMEICPKNVDAIIERFEHATGIKAKKQ